MRAPVIIEAVRSPLGTEGGALRAVSVDALVTPFLRRLSESCPEPDAIREVVLGNVRGPGGNLARYCALDAGLPEHVPGLTLDRQCGAGMAAIEHARGTLAFEPGFVIAGGAQSASTQPLTAWPAAPGAEPVPFTRAPFAPPRFEDPDMGLAADLLAAERGISRERQDAYALRSHERAVAAQDAGIFDAEIVPLAGVTADERPRRGWTLDRLARFRPVFRAGGTVTAANACGVNDGSAAVLLTDAETHDRLGVPGLRILDVVTVGGAPRRPGFGIVPAVERVCARLGLGVDAFDAIECNEAFAGQVLACLDAVGIPEEANCRQGGALALGHPWAASGAVLVTRLFTQLVRERRGRLGLAAIAIAGGMGSAMVVEAC